MTALGDRGADAWSAILGATLITDPLDRILSCLAVYVVVAAIAVGTRARFPQAEWIVADDDDFALRVGLLDARDALMRVAERAGRRARMRGRGPHDRAA